MTLSYFLSRIKINKSICHEIIPISFNFQEVIQEKYFIQTEFGTQKAGITVRKYVDMINHYHLIGNQKNYLKYFLSYLVVILL